MASQDKTGGYCPKCDTVWVAPGKCNCYDAEPKQFKDIWNDAIEAAAQCVEQANRDGPYNAIISHREIRKLKK